MVVETSSLMSPRVQKSLLLKGRPGCNSLDFKSKLAVTPQSFAVQKKSAELLIRALVVVFFGLKPWNEGQVCSVFDNDETSDFWWRLFWWKKWRRASQGQISLAVEWTSLQQLRDDTEGSVVPALGDHRLETENWTLILMMLRPNLSCF